MEWKGEVVISMMRASKIGLLDFLSTQKTPQSYITLQNWVLTGNGIRERQIRLNFFEPQPETFLF